MLIITIQKNVKAKLKEARKAIFDSKTYAVDGFAPSLLVNYSLCSIRVG